MRNLFLDLALKLDSLKPDGVNSLLDTSLITVIPEHSSRGHTCHNIPIVTAGSAGGVIKTGQYLDLRNQAFTYFLSNYNITCGYSMNQFWANCLRAVGVPPSEYEALNWVDNAHSKYIVNGVATGYGPTSLASLVGPNNLAVDYSLYYQNYDQGPAQNLSDWLPGLTS